jgi:acetoacetyl-CoA synthetase
MFQSGSALPAEGFQYVYEHIKQDLFFNSGLGGTDVQMGILEGTPWQPVYAGQIAGPALGVKANVYDEEGKPVVGEPGELVVERPFPSVPLGLWGDEGGEQFRATYFGKYPGVWRHGDYVQKDPATGGFIPLGRSDFVLKPSGVRIGPAEIYSVLARIPEVRDCLVVGQKWKGDERIVLFVAPREGLRLTEELAERIRTRLRQEASPRHVPARILEVPDVPYTLNLKRAEGAVWRIVNGGEVPPQLRGALANPEVLSVYERLAREELNR